MGIGDLSHSEKPAASLFKKDACLEPYKKLIFHALQKVLSALLARAGITLTVGTKPGH